MTSNDTRDAEEVAFLSPEAAESVQLGAWLLEKVGGGVLDLAVKGVAVGFGTGRFALDTVDRCTGGFLSATGIHAVSAGSLDLARFITDSSLELGRTITGLSTRHAANAVVMTNRLTTALGRLRKSFVGLERA